MRSGCYHYFVAYYAIGELTIYTVYVEVDSL